MWSFVTWVTFLWGGLTWREPPQRKVKTSDEVICSLKVTSPGKTKNWLDAAKLKNKKQTFLTKKYGNFVPLFFKWKRWIVLKKDEMIKIWCISITNHVKSCKKINEHLPETDNVHITWSWVDWWSKLDWIEIEFQDEHLSHVGEVNWNENGKIKCESTSEVDWIRIGRKRQKSLDF